MTTDAQSGRVVKRPWTIWVVTFAIYTLLAFIISLQTYYYNRSSGSEAVFLQILKPSLVSFWIYALLTPPVLWLCWHFPIERRRFHSRLLLHVAASLLFAASYVSVRIVTYPVKYRGEVVPLSSRAWKSMFLFLLFDSTVNTYGMIAIFGHMMLYYQGLRERELLSVRLEGELAQAQLAMLKMQLHPHFLFNTLHAASALTRDNPRAAEDMLARLSDLLRLTLAADAAQEVPLQTELDFIGHYLDIEQIRFADRLVVQVESTPDTLDALVPNMLLQPLVENALMHGIAAQAQGGSLNIQAWRDEQDLCLSVRDTGPGFPPHSNRTTPQGIGLSNTRSRLEHLYPGNHLLSLANVPSGGALVIVRLPFRPALLLKRSQFNGQA